MKLHVPEKLTKYFSVLFQVGHDDMSSQNFEVVSLAIYFMLLLESKFKEEI